VVVRAVVRAVVCVEWEAAHLTRVYWVAADLAADSAAEFAAELAVVVGP
jgi:hypothetical protein